MALVIMRKKNQKVRVTTEDGKELLAEVVKVKGGQVYVAFTGPKSFKIDRPEKDKEEFLSACE